MKVPRFMELWVWELWQVPSAGRWPDLRPYGDENVVC